MTIAPGLCSITFRSLTADEVLQVAQRAGVEGIEWGADGHVPPGGGPAVEALRARCRDAGVEIVSYGSYLGFAPADADETGTIDAVLDSAQALGAPMVRIWTELGVSPASPADDRRRVTDRTARVADEIAARGLIAALEFHPYTLTETAGSANALLTTLARPNLRTHWQPDPALPVEAALAELAQVTQHLAHVHTFFWGASGIDDRRALTDGVDLWPPALELADRDGPQLPGQRFALCEYVRDDDPEQLVTDVNVLRRWLDALPTRKVSVLRDGRRADYGKSSTGDREKMSSGPPSGLSGVHGTALSAAALRAWHMLIGGEPEIFRDELALALTGMGEAEVVALGKRVSADSASTCILRSRFTEDRLAAARDRLSQYVVLGAGLDSFALRMGDALGGLIVFEVDDPPFQEWKSQRIQELGLEPPPQLRFVPCDFESTSIAEALAAGGFVADKPCFISWLGVTQYLTREAVTETLRWAGERPAGSELVLTYLESNAKAAALRTSMARTGIALVSDFTTPEIMAMVEEAGFSRIEHLSPEEAEERYFQGRTDGLRAPAIQRLLSAIV